MHPEERRTVAVTGFLHGLVHANILAIPIFLGSAWRLEFSADDVTLGLLAATAYACFGLGSIPFGYLSDRRGASGLLVVCAAGIALSLVLIALSLTLPVLVLGLASLGFFSGIYHPTGLSLISRTVREAGRGMGWHGMGGSVGIALGPATIAGLLGIGWPWRSTVAILLVPALAGLALLRAVRIREVPRANAGVGVKASIRGIASPGFLLILLVYMFAGLAYWGSLTFLPRLVGDASYAVLLGLGAVGQVLSGHLADRSRPERTLLGLSLAAATLLAVLASGSPILVSASAWAFGFMLFSLEPLQNTLVTREVPEASRGVAFGMTFLSVFGVGSFGSILAGFLRAKGYANELYLILAAFLAVSGGCALLAGKRTREGS